MICVFFISSCCLDVEGLKFCFVVGVVIFSYFVVERDVDVEFFRIWVMLIEIFGFVVCFLFEVYLCEICLGFFCCVFICVFIMLEDVVCFSGLVYIFSVVVVVLFIKVLRIGY